MIIESLIEVGCYIFGFVSALFVLSLIIKRNDIADIAWGIGIVIVALVALRDESERGALSAVLVTLVLLWGLRLSARIFLRNIKKGEDSRYRKWREEWGKIFYVRSYLQVYLLQGALMIVVGYPFIHAGVYGDAYEIGLLTVVGVLVWCIGYFFEVVGDYQLDTFLKSKREKGDVLTTGLWKYTRHPNYFGEVTMWWGVWLIVAPLPMSYTALIGPATITFLILKVSGIPMLERTMAENPKFRKYAKKTSVFFPLPPKK